MIPGDAREGCKEWMYPVEDLDVETGRSDLCWDCKVPGPLDGRDNGLRRDLRVFGVRGFCKDALDGAEIMSCGAVCGYNCEGRGAGLRGSAISATFCLCSLRKQLGF